MSIIWGRLNTKGKTLKATSLTKISDTFVHIEFNKKGSWSNERCQLVSLLKFNTPESVDEAFPYTAGLSGLTIVADARIDNRLELIKKLKITNVTATDGSIILTAYQQWGEQCVQYLIGAFVFAIWDERKKKVFCARDQIGIRPFYYTFNQHFFAFSSEKKGLLILSDFDKSINNNYVLNQLIFKDQETTETFYLNIKKLLPAHTITIEEGNIKIQKYWDLDETKEIRFKNQNDYIDAFREKLGEAVSCRTRSYKKVGAEFSGGLDSSGIVALAQQSLSKKGKELHTFARLLPDEHRGKTYPYEDDKELVLKILKKVGITNSHILTTSPYYDTVKGLDFTLKVFDGLDDYSSDGTDSIKVLAKSLGVGVILSGFPGDELVTSYVKEAPLAYLSKHRWLKYFRMGRIPYKKDRATIPWKMLWLQFAYFYIFRISPSLASSIWKQLRSRKRIGLEKEWWETACFLKENFLTQHPAIRSLVYEKPIVKPELNLRKIQKQYILRPHTAYRIEMENTLANYRGLEMRYPLADIRLLQFVLSLPVEQKRNEKYSRLIYRRSMEGILPNEVVWRKTEGAFSVPFSIIDFRKSYPFTTKWLKSLDSLKNNSLSFLDVEKLNALVHKSYDQWAGDKPKPFSYTAGNRMPLIFKIARLIQKEPEKFNFF